jgi:integrase
MRVYKRGKRGTWWVDLTVDGQRIKRSSGTTDEAAAREWAATTARDLYRQRRLGDAPAVTWDTAVLSWLGEHQHLRSLEEVKRSLRWLTERLQGKQLAAIDTNLIRRIASERRAQAVNSAEIAAATAAGQKTPEPKLTSAATVNRHLADISRILHHAQERGWLATVPKVTKLPDPAKRLDWLTHDQARVLLAELPEHLASMARFALATGLRESNVRLLEWSQVDQGRALAWVYCAARSADRSAGCSRCRAWTPRPPTNPPARSATTHGERPAFGPACPLCGFTTCATPGRVGMCSLGRRWRCCRSWAAGPA